nr:AzlD domain-containing protein [uncultured Dongia sp.]
MSIAPDFLLALLAMGLASFACRAGGFFLMRFVTVTPRLEAALRILPLGVMIGIVAPVAALGKIPELIGLGLVLLLMKVTGNDFLAALSGIVAVAIIRQLL